MSTVIESSERRRLLLHDTLLILIMGVLAACGLIYEYLLSHYAGRILGAVETAIYSMIGLMIVSMGIGSFTARALKDPFSSFAWLEAVIAVLGVSAVLLIAGLVAVAGMLPVVIADTFLLPPDLMPEGGLFAAIQQIASSSPYFFGFVLGFFIGMEIPLIARVRQEIHQAHLTHNTGTIYGADYIGAGFGAVVWVLLMLAMEVTEAAVLTALANVAAGTVFLVRYWRRVRFAYVLAAFHGVVLVLALVIHRHGDDWMKTMTNVLYMDNVVYDSNTRYQHLTITERYLSADREPVYSFYLNGRLQFASHDEHIYHGMLVHPAAAVAERRDEVLIVGGGDGLALREVLRWNPRRVTLLDLDEELVRFFTASDERQVPRFREAMWDLNDRSFSDDRVELRFGDAFIEIDALLADRRLFDVIILDLPDPSHPDLNRLYSVNFYGRLRHLMAGGGVLVAQSTSPYHAKRAFLCIGKTVSAAGFDAVDQYRQNIPSFGEWGWTIATKQGRGPRERLNDLTKLEIDDGWSSLGIIRGAFEFPRGFFERVDDIEVNTLGSQHVYRYHYEAWQLEQGYYRE